MRRAGVMLSALVAVSLLPTQALATPPPDDPEAHSVALPGLQQAAQASEDETKTEELASWSGAPAEPPAEYNPVDVTPPVQDQGVANLDQAAGQLVPVEDLPVKIGQATATAADPTPPAPSGTWSVEVEARTATEAVDVDGAIVTVTPPPTGSTPLDVELDYRAFQDLYGTEWSSRLRFVQLPECFLTTPELEECSTPVDVPSTNDAATDTVRATIDPAAAQSQGLSTQAGGGTTVLAATDSGAGAGGSYKATSLSPSGSWAAGGNSGGFSWTYPLGVPAPPAGPAPRINFSYSSQSVDGKTSVANSQASWIGDGWDYHPGFVERRYRPCSDDLKNKPNNDNASDKKKSDLCWASDNLVLSLGGTSAELVRDDASGAWVSAADDGVTVQYKAKNGTNKDRQTDKYNGEYWQVTTRDGTRYLFGREDVDGTGTRLTNSALTVPVVGNHAGEPCHQTSYAASFCEQAWRWNLDYVEDVHGNAMVIDWKAEANHYAQNGKFTQPKAYERGGYPTQIRYGLRKDNLNGVPAGKVLFTVDERCIREGSTACSATEFESKNYADRQPWWDTPSTLHCKSSPAKCYVSAPTFWSRIRLIAVETFGQRTPGSTELSRVDRWDLKQSFPKQRTDTHPPLWLESVTRTGFGTEKDAQGNQSSSTSMPTVSFIANVVDMPNRVATSDHDATPDFDRLRVETIRTETGGEIYVDYSDKCPVGVSHPAPGSNKTRCFPVHWSPDPDLEKPNTEWFNKYVVDRVLERDRATRQPDVVTTYAYEGPAWAKDTDEFSKAELRTFSQWRGHERVTVTRGETEGTGTTKATEQSKTVTRYFQGMSRDAGRPVIVVKDSTEQPLVEDLPAFQGRAAETITYTKAGSEGVIHAREVSLPYAKTIATRVRGDDLPALNAYRTGTVRTDRVQPLGGATTRKGTTETVYDDEYGFPRQVHTYVTGADGATRTDETCTATTYVHNTTAHIIGLPSEVRSATGDCLDTTPAADRIIARTRTSYDGLNFGAAPTRGLPSRVDTLAADGIGSITSARTEYDALGRVTKSLDALGNTTSFLFKPATGPAFEVESTNAKGHKATSVLDPARGTVLTTTDANNRRSISKYDDLGRVTEVWSPSRNPATDSASAQFEYQLADNKVPAVTTRTLRDNGTYASSVVIYDGLLRPRQTQTEAMGAGRIVTDTLYNANGDVSEAKSAYLAPKEPTAEIFVPTTVFDVPHSTETAYDGLGRPVRVTTLKNDVPQHSATTAYGADWTLSRTGMSADGTTPLPGSRAVRTDTDALGRTVKVRHYTTTNLTGPAPAALTTSYAYDPRGKLAKVTDTGGNEWTYTYDARGRLTASIDPDVGGSKFGYDDLDRRISSEDTLTKAQYTLYDELGRTTELRDDSPTGPLVFKWTYDTLPGAVGMPVASIRYAQGAAFTSEVTGYDSEYRPTGTKITIPATSETTGLAGTYAYAHTYTRTGQPQSTTLPATPAGLAAEKLITRYNEEGAPLTTSGAAWYTSGTVYSPLGQILRTTSGQSPQRIWNDNRYDEFTGRLHQTESHRESTIPKSHISTRTYGYDTVGNVTSIAEDQTTVGADKTATVAKDQQCFSYDPMGRLVHAWTGLSDCRASSTAQGAGPDLTQVTAGANGGGYWHSYGFDTIGNRTQLTVHDLATADLDDVFTYTYGRTETNNGTQAPSKAQPHTLTKVDSTVKEPGSSVTSMSTYTSDPMGNTTQRTIGGDTQTLVWDRRHKVTSVTGFGNGTGSLINVSGKCLDLRGRSTAEGTPIQLYTCNGTAAQQWNLDGDKLKVLGKCATADGAKLVIGTCDGRTQQRFVHRPGDDSLYNPASDTCIDVPGADYTDGKALQLIACSAVDAQKWRLGDATSYVYDAAGNRLLETTSTTRTLYLPDARVTVTSAGVGVSAERYYTHPGAPTTVRTTQGSSTAHKLSVLLTDHQGTSTTAVDQSAGQPLTRRAFDPYGNPRGTTDPTEAADWPGRQTFVGTGVNDPTTGLTHIGAREYDPTTGRFLSADPLIDITDPLQMNGYTYANGSPVTYSDPSGLAPDDCTNRGVSCAPQGNGSFEVKQNSNYAKYNSTVSSDDPDFAANTLTADTAAVVHAIAADALSPSQYKDWQALYERNLDKYRGGRQSLTYGNVIIAANQACYSDFVCPKSMARSFTAMMVEHDAAAGLFEDGGRSGSAKAVKAIKAQSAKMKGFCPGNSFEPGTKVLMADGSTKSIEDIQVGDEVLAGDPESDLAQPEIVTGEIKGQGVKHLVKVTIYTDGKAGSATAEVTATDGHPFWVPELGRWVDATDLTPGQWLRTGAGTYVQVASIERWTAQSATVHNLTVADLHTYYVLAGATPVLVHNSNCPLTGGFKAGVTPDEIADINRGFGGETLLSGSPANTMANASRYNSFWDKSAVVIRDIAGGHMFNNGNKRTAQAVVEQLMQRNNVTSGPTSADLRSVIDRVGKGQLHDVSDISAALRGY
ncbi:ricin-type beta-trefoil lectin domain protein [Streptomyces venezuelae]|uniref:ricin-type beta-trefoil lectin domain protein n=1 Tax=Streptomyces venezuelae TaxID=54571 RepID=UPI00278BB6B1|nr:ricin-type beta-trefoil lectin domain protein [Streptomyces venezuelae]